MIGGRLNVPLQVGYPEGYPDRCLEHAEECPSCGYDTLLTFPLWALLPTGLARAGRVKRCARTDPTRRAC